MIGFRCEASLSYLAVTSQLLMVRQSVEDARLTLRGVVAPARAITGELGPKRGDMCGDLLERPDGLLGSVSLPSAFS